MRCNSDSQASNLDIQTLKLVEIKRLNDILTIGIKITLKNWKYLTAPQLSRHKIWICATLRLKVQTNVLYIHYILLFYRISVLNITLLYGLNIKEPDIDTFDVFESSSIQFIHEQTLFLFPRTGDQTYKHFLSPFL